MRKIFIDCGAHRGESIKAFCDNFANSEEYEIYSFEPGEHPIVLDSLRETVENYQNKVKNIELSSKAVWTHNGRIPFYENEKSSESSSLFYREQFVNNAHVIEKAVECIDLSSWIKNNFSKDDFIILKLDIEGGEYGVIKKLYDEDALQYIDIFYCEIHGIKCEKGYEDTLELVRMVEDRGVPFYNWAAESYGRKGASALTEEKLKAIFIRWYTQWVEQSDNNQFSPLFKKTVIDLLPQMVGVPGAAAIIPLNGGGKCVVQLHNNGVSYILEQNKETMEKENEKNIY